MTKPANGFDLQQELDDLRESNDHLGEVIEKASRIIHRNNKEFGFLFQGSDASQSLYQLLLIEWSQFQTGNAMAGIPLQQAAKTLLPLQTEKIPFLGAGWHWNDEVRDTSWSAEQYISSKEAFSITLVPMVDGIAIGAP